VSRALIGALGLIALACDAEREERLAREVARLCRAEEQLRQAPNGAKAQLLAELSRAPCPEPAACAARDSCTSAYTLHVDALALTQVAKQNIADGQNEQAAKLLGTAETKLEQARSGIERCTAQFAALRRAHRVGS
jgi:hypothetical protein